MFLKRNHRKRGVPGLNTSSTADISFMLLIFFLITTSMEADKAMPRQLPPLNPDDQTQMDIDRTKVMSIHLMKDGVITIDNKPVEIKKIRRQVKEFIVKTGPSHVLEITSDHDADYDSYFNLQNQIIRSYRELRDAAARHRTGKPYAKCDEETRTAIFSAYPQRIQEKAN